MIMGPFGTEPYDPEPNEASIAIHRAKRLADAEAKLADIRPRIEAAIQKVYANIGPSPVLVELRDALAILDRGDSDADT